MAAITADQWKLAFEAVKEQFELSDILSEQRESIKAFFDGKDVFVNLPTGYGKSLIFQSLPIVADIVKSKPRGSSVVVVAIRHLSFTFTDGGPSAIFEQYGYPSNSHYECGRPRNNSTGFEWQLYCRVGFSRVFVVYSYLERHF